MVAAGCASFAVERRAPHQGDGSRVCWSARTGPPCGKVEGVGVVYEYTLYTHCGVEYAYFDGRYWLADPPLDDGSGNPPRGWGNPFQSGEMRLVSRDRAEFRAGELTASFEPAPASYRPPTCA